MFDFLKQQDGYYRSPEGREFNSTHMFEISGASRGKVTATLMKWDHDGAELWINNLLPNKCNRKCLVSICNREVDYNIINDRGP